MIHPIGYCPPHLNLSVFKIISKKFGRFLLNAQENTKYSHKSARKWKALVTLARPSPAQESLLPSQEDCAQITRTLSWLQLLWVGKKSFNLAASEKKCWPQLSKSRRGEGGRKGTEEGEQVYGIQTRVLSRPSLSGGRKRTEDHETQGNSQAVPGGPLFGGSNSTGDSGLKDRTPLWL